jgi:signal transduction histidine kinase
MEPPREAAWARSVHALFVSRVRLAGVLAAVLVPLGWGLDFIYVPDQLRAFLLIRLGFSLGVLGLVALTVLPALARHPETVAIVLCVWIAAGIEWLIVRSGAFSSEYYAGLIVLIIAAGLLFPFGARGMGLTSLGIIAVHGLPALWLRPLDAKGLLVHVYFIANAGLCATIAAYVGSRLRRREFDQRQDLEKLAVELRELDRLKSQFFANVSHELRTPLTVMLAALEMVELPTLAPAERERMRVLENEARALLRLINDLLERVELDSGRAKPERRAVDLQQLVREQVSEFAPLAERRSLELSVQLDAPAPIAADPGKLASLVRNLLSNALKFTQAGGEVRVRLEQTEELAILEVEDTGPGIPPADRERIFERFTRLPAAEAAQTPGWGIGLSLVREVAVLHGGSVEVADAPGRGALFRVRLPIGTTEGLTAAEPAAAPRPSSDEVVWDPPEAPLAGPSSATVLIAEDHAPLRRFLVELLGRYYRVLEASDGEAALKLAREERPDLVLADVMMPGRSGHALVEALRSDLATADIRHILITARGGSDAAVSGLSSGADDFVGKPFSPRELVARIRAQLRIRDLDRSLAHAQKLATIGTLLAGLAHEIRNPVNALINGLPVIRREVQIADPIAEELFGVVEDSARRIARIVDDLLGSSRRNDGPPGRWSPREGIDRTVRLFAPRNPRVQVRCEHWFDGQVRGHGERLDQVMVNLVDNAYRAMDSAGGQLAITTEPFRGGVRIQVRDCGEGIASEVLPRLFDPFFTTRPTGQGTGLGLHLCRQIVESHRGTIEASSSARGAVFTVWLPGGEA